MTTQQDTPLRPKELFYNISKVATYIASNTGIVDKQSLQLTTIPKDNVYITVDLTSDEHFKLSSPNVTLYDFAVMNAAYTVLQNRRECFTPEMIVRTMACDPYMDVTPQKKSAVTRSLNKLRHIDISIDCTEEFRARGLLDDDGDEIILSSYLMPLDVARVKPAHHKDYISGYRFIREPALYTYAAIVEQIVSVPTELLLIDDASVTNDVIVLRDYLVRRIIAMQNEKNHIVSTRIAYERYDRDTQTYKGLLPSLGYDKEYQESHGSNWRRKKANLHRSVTTILDSFVRKGLIAGYEVVYSGGKRKTVYGVDIKLAGSKNTAPPKT